MKSINSILLLMAFLLSSCAPATIAVPTFTPHPTETLTPSPTVTQTPSPTPTITPTPTPIGGGSGKLIFEYYRVAFEKSFPDLKGEVNIFISNVDGTDLTPVTNGLKGFNRIESISTDGRMVLVSSRSDYAAKGDLYLFRFDSLGSDPIKLAGGLTEGRQAIFFDNTHVVYVGQGRDNYGFYITNLDGTDPRKIGTPTGRAWSLLASDGRRVYWGTIEKRNFKDSSGFLYTYGDSQTLWWTNIDGSGQGTLESNGQQVIGSYAFSGDGTTIAWIPTQTEPDCAFSPFYTKWITDGSYTNWGGLWGGIPNGNPGSSGGEVINMAWVKAYVRRCFIMYVASLPELENPMRIVLMPPDNLLQGNFTFSKNSYALKWKPDGSTLLLLNDGTDGFAGTSVDHEPLLYYVNPTHPEAQLAEYKHKLFSPSNARKTYILGLSPDGQQILVANRAGGPYIRILNLNTVTFSDLFGKKLTPDSDVGRIGSIYWLP